MFQTVKNVLNNKNSYVLPAFGSDGIRISTQFLIKNFFSKSCSVPTIDIEMSKIFVNEPTIVRVNDLKVLVSTTIIQKK